MTGLMGMLSKDWRRWECSEGAFGKRMPQRLTVFCQEGRGGGEVAVAIAFAATKGLCSCLSSSVGVCMGELFSCCCSWYRKI